MESTSFFSSLRNRIFAKLYFAQTISLIGDSFTWVGLALISYQFGEDRSSLILSTALTLRVIAFIIFSPFAGVLADRIDRKKILYVTHFCRMAIVACFPFINAEWQIYLLIFLLNVFNAFFTPTYRSIIPQIIKKDDYRQAVGLSTATYQVLGILGPGMAGIAAVWLGAKEIFLVDAASFILAGIIILTLPVSLRIQEADASSNEQSRDWQNVLRGLKLLFANRYLQFALAIEFFSALAGAQILVNSVGHVKSWLSLDDKHYGWAMSAFALGAAISAFLSSKFDDTKSRRKSLIIGALFMSFAIIPANLVGFNGLLLLWAFAGIGQSLAEIPSETLIGENIPAKEQGKVYGSHFAVSHLWWAIAYPIAGYSGQYFPSSNFLIAGCAVLVLSIIAILLFRKNEKLDSIHSN
jgi:MFS transporter, NRE family, putaive nickel resistance protein